MKKNIAFIIIAIMVFSHFLAEKSMAALGYFEYKNYVIAVEDLEITKDKIMGGFEKTVGTIRGNVGIGANKKEAKANLSPIKTALPGVYNYFYIDLKQPFRGATNYYFNLTEGDKGKIKIDVSSAHKDKLMKKMK